MVSSMWEATSRPTNLPRPDAGPPWPAYSMTATTPAIVPSWARSPTSTPLPRRASASSRMAASWCSTSSSSAGPLPWIRTSASRSAVAGSLNGGSERTLASRISRSVNSLLVIRSPRGTLHSAGLAPETRGELLARTCRLATRGTLRAESHRAGERTAAERVSSRHHDCATTHNLADGDLDGQIQTLLEGQDHALGRDQFAADEHPAQVAADQPRLDLIARADATRRPADVAQPPDGREPVGVLDVGHDREGFFGRDWKRDLGACLDHESLRLVHHCRERVRRFEPEPRVDALRDYVVLVDIEAAARHVVEDVGADGGKPRARDPLAAVLRGGVHALDLHDVRGPCRKLGLEQHLMVAHPDPAPASLDEAEHAHPPRRRIDRKRVDAHLLAVHARRG